MTVELTDLPPDRVRLRVIDDGAGITADFLPYVFDRFRQADGSSSRQHGGLGLGLAIVRHLVELHGGTVQASSEGPGFGATFTVEFPLDDDGRSAIPDYRERVARPMSTPLAPPAGALSGLHLLVVDDQEDARQLLQGILMAAGATVEVAASAAEALEALEALGADGKRKVDALLADIGMPGADGYGLIAEVRRREAGRGTHLPSAAVSAYVSELDRRRAWASGFDAHIAKPIDSVSVVAAVLSLCGRPLDPIGFS